MRYLLAFALLWTCGCAKKAKSSSAASTAQSVSPSAANPIFANQQTDVSLPLEGNTFNSSTGIHFNLSGGSFAAPFPATATDAATGEECNFTATMTEVETNVVVPPEAAGQGPYFNGLTVDLGTLQVGNPIYVSGSGAAQGVSDAQGQADCNSLTNITAPIFNESETLPGILWVQNLLYPGTGGWNFSLNISSVETYVY